MPQQRTQPIKPVWAPPPQTVPSSPPGIESPDFNIDPATGQPTAPAEPPSPAEPLSPAEQRAQDALAFARIVSPPPAPPIPTEGLAPAPLVPPEEDLQVGPPPTAPRGGTFRQEHPILSAIGRGFARAYPLIQGGLIGAAAGAYEPSPLAAAGKGFEAAELLPYKKASLALGNLAKLQELDLQKAHADYYRALAPAVDERMKIMRDRADAYKFAQEATALYRQGMLRNRQAYLDMMDRAKTADEKRKVQETAARIERDNAYTRLINERIAAGEPEARVRQLAALARELEATGEFREAQAENMPDVWQSQAERNRAQAAAAGALAGQRQRQVSIEDDASRLLSQAGSIDRALQLAYSDPMLAENRAGTIQFLTNVAAKNRQQALTSIANNYHMRRNAILANAGLDDEQKQRELELLDQNFVAASRALMTPSAKPAPAPAPAPTTAQPRLSDPLGIR
jgi:hypothetical protein